VEVLMVGLAVRAMLLGVGLAVQVGVASAETLSWFAPLPPMPERPGRLYPGAEDFMALFSRDAPWQKAARHIQVFKLYAEWVYGSATDAQLKRVVTDLHQRGIALAVEGGPLEPGDCGNGIESFAAIQWPRIAARIKAAGGTLDYIDMDEPYYFGHLFSGPQACRWPASEVARKLDAFANRIHALFPNVTIGETEPLTDTVDPAAYCAWIDTFRQVNGYNLPFLHLDVDWQRPDWVQAIKSIEACGRRRATPVGIIYTGNPGDPSDAIWLANAGGRVKDYEGEVGTRPAHVLFQSWHAHPYHLLPETANFTFTRFIDDYFSGNEYVK
jgi:hypothetical protein